MTDRQILHKIKELSNGEFGQDIVIAGDAQIVLQRLMEIYILVSNHLSSNSYSEMSNNNPQAFDAIQLPKYYSKKSRMYFSPNTDPAKAHKNGFNLAIREIKKQTNNTP